MNNPAGQARHNRFPEEHRLTNLLGTPLYDNMQAYAFSPMTTAHRRLLSIHLCC